MAGGVAWPVRACYETGPTGFGLYRAAAAAGIAMQPVAFGCRLGRLKPDVLVYDRGEPVVVADAKYKRLQNRWPERPQGVDRADLYQLTSYLARYSPHGEAQGLLLYPRDPHQIDEADAEGRGPWRTETNTLVRFSRLGSIRARQ